MMAKGVRGMAVWIFTFGITHPLRNKVQPIRGSYEDARAKMFELYGKKWAFQYHMAELDELNKARGTRLEPPYELLPEVKTDVDM